MSSTSGGEHVPRILGTAPWVYAAVGTADLLFTLGAVGFYLHRGFGPAFVIFAVLATLAALAMTEAVVSRIVLRTDTLEVQSLRSRGRYPASEIRAVKWEGGSGVALQLATGRWVKLPELGRSSQGVANTIRAWLKGPASGAGQ